MIKNPEVIGSWSSFGTLKYCKLSWITFTFFLSLFIMFYHFTCAFRRKRIVCLQVTAGGFDAMDWDPTGHGICAYCNDMLCIGALLCNDVSDVTYFFYCNSLAKFGQSGWKFYCCTAWIAWMSPLVLLSESPQQNSAKAGYHGILKSWSIILSFEVLGC